MRDKDGKSTPCIQFVERHDAEALIQGQNHEPRDSEDNGRETVVNRERIQCAIFRIKGKSPTFFADQFFAGLALQFGGARIIITRCGSGCR